MSNGRSVGVIAASVLAIVGVAVVIVLVAGRREPKAFEPGTPEAALQAYLVAWDAGDLEAAYASLSSAAQRQITFEDYERAARQWRSQQATGVDRLVLFDRSAGNAERMTVYLIVEETYGDQFGGGPYRSERQVDLVREDGAWRTAEPLVWLDPADYYSTFKEP
jgi:hypothetical protein